jgi:hypothetical protein
MIAGENHPLLNRIGTLPWFSSGDFADAMSKFLVAQWRAARIEARKLVKLHDGAAHHKAVAGIAMFFLFVLRIAVRNDFSLFVSPDR